MPIDASIPLQVKTTPIEQPDLASTYANIAKIKSAQLDTAAKQNDEEYKLISAATPDNYDQVRQLAVQKYGQDALKLMPPVYDKSALDNLAASRLDIKDKLTLQQQKLEYQLGQDKFGEEKRHNLADEATAKIKADSPFGTSYQGHVANILMNGDPSTPAYALAANAATQPRMQAVTQPDGSTQLVAVTPKLPSSIRQPTAPDAAPSPQPTAPNPAASPMDAIQPGAGPVLTPPVIKGATDSTPTTKGALLPPPPGARSYSVEPIAGTSSPAKLSDDQAKAAGFAQRTQASHDIINNLSTNGYAPSMLTDELGDSKLGNRTLSDQGQQFVQAKRDFVNALLRRESGAAISQSEFDNANKQYFPQPGDKPGTLIQKAQNRELAIQSLRLSAGAGGRAALGAAPAPVSNAQHLSTPQAAEIKASYQAGKITKDQAKSALQALGGQ